MANRLTGDQRGRVAEEIMEWGNLVFAGLVIGQFISGKELNLLFFVLGICGLIIGYSVSLLVMLKGGR